MKFFNWLFRKINNEDESFSEQDKKDAQEVAKALTGQHLDRLTYYDRFDEKNSKNRVLTVKMVTKIFESLERHQTSIEGIVFEHSYLNHGNREQYAIQKGNIIAALKKDSPIHLSQKDNFIFRVVLREKDKQPLVLCDIRNELSHNVIINSRIKDGPWKEDIIDILLELEKTALDKENEVYHENWLWNQKQKREYEELEQYYHENYKKND